MPKYVFQCNQCDRTIEEFRKVEERDTGTVCGEQKRVGRKQFILCSGHMVRGLPKILDPIMLETADQYRNVKHRKDQDKRLRKRAADYFQQNEMEEMIEKVGEKQAKQYGWVDKDGKKNKGGL